MGRRREGLYSRSTGISRSDRPEWSLNCRMTLNDASSSESMVDGPLSRSTEVIVAPEVLL